MTLQELQELRRKLAADMRAIVERADSEKREMTAEEAAEFDRIESDYDQCVADIDEKNRAVARSNRVAELTDVADREQHRQQRATRIAPPSDGADITPVSFSQVIEQYCRLPRDEQQSHRVRWAIEQAMTPRGQAHTSLFDRWIRSGGRAFDSAMIERAALQMDSDTAGGVLVPPVEFIARLIDGLDDQVFMRGLATVLPMTKAVEVRIPSLDTDPADADWTVELSPGTADTAMAFGKRSLYPKPVRKYILVSKDLLRQGELNVANIVADRLRYKFGITEEKAFLTGTGAGQPLGVFTASADGISTARDVSTDNTTTAITADGLINAKYALKAQYHSQPGFRWIFHRDAVKMIRKLKDGNGQYLWQPGLAMDKGDTILDVPFSISEYAPNTFTTGLYVGIIGDFSQYYIADVSGMEMTQARELHLGTWQDGFYASRKCDGMPVLEEAFVRVTLA